MSESAPLARIQPARWFRHALSIGDLASILETRVRALECAKDAGAAFCRTRLGQLRHIEGLLDAGSFNPATPWVERVETEHVHQYLRAAESWDRGDLALTPAPWRAVFAHVRQRNASPADAACAAAIAHLTYDLPLALARVGLTTFSGADTRAAYGRLTDEYAATAAEATPRVRALPLHARTARHVTGAWHRELRAQAWDDALLLNDADEHTRDIAFTRIELAALCEIRRVTQR